METLNYLLSIGTTCSLSFPCQNSVIFPPTKFKLIIFSIFSTPYSHGSLINPVYTQNTIILTSCQTNNTLPQKLGAISNLQRPYLRTTSKYCSSMILPQGLELGCIRQEEVAPICYMINMSTKQLLKRRKLTFRII